MTTNTINTEAILTNAGRVLSTRRIHITMQRICKANGHSRRVFTASRETNTERFGKNWARLIAAHHTDIHRAEGIDWMLQDLSLIHISEPTRPRFGSRMPSSA